jgi:SAM-dependent methyltransferase
VHRPEDDWEQLARREPHFAVLTNEEFLRERLTPEALERFWRSGEEDVAFLFDVAGPIEPEIAVDFGCGVGRLTCALAKRAKRVIGVDASPTMLALAPKLPNVTYTDRLSESADFICSLIVFQHIPVDRGEELFRDLLQRLRPGGVAAIHFAFSRPGGALKKFARKIRGSMPIVHRIAQIVRGERNLPYMQINTYDRDKLISIAREEGCREPRFVPYDQAEVKGAILLTSRA